MAPPWDPRCVRPEGLVAPTRVDPGGTTGPTRGQARGPAWRRTSAGMYVPSNVDGEVVEQRILEQSARVRGYGAVTAWAALRWHGAAFFDGTTDAGRGLLPVPLITHTKLCPDPRVAITQEQLAPTEALEIGGVPCTTIQRALFDEVRRVESVREAACAIAMAAAARLISRRLFATYLAQRNGRASPMLARQRLSHATSAALRKSSGC